SSGTGADVPADGFDETRMDAGQYDAAPFVRDRAGEPIRANDHGHDRHDEEPEPRDNGHVVGADEGPADEANDAEDGGCEREATRGPDALERFVRPRESPLEVLRREICRDDERDDAEEEQDPCPRRCVAERLSGP